MKKAQKKLRIQRDTVANLQSVVGGGFTDFCGGGNIEKTVYHPVHSERCSIGCPIQA